MKGFVVFELAPPIRWRPLFEKSGPIRRVVWLWFSISIVLGWKWTEFLHTVSKKHTREEFERAFKESEDWFV